MVVHEILHFIQREILPFIHVAQSLNQYFIQE